MKNKYADKMIRNSDHKGARRVVNKTVMECFKCGTPKNVAAKPCVNCGSCQTLVSRKTGGRHVSDF